MTTTEWRNHLQSRHPKCIVKGCGFRCSEKANLQAHLVDNHPVCTHCSNSDKQVRVLDGDVLAIHKAGEDLHCQWCSKFFGRIELLTSHQLYNCFPTTTLVVSEYIEVAQRINRWSQAAPISINAQKDGSKLTQFDPSQKGSEVWSMLDLQAPAGSVNWNENGPYAYDLLAIAYRFDGEELCISEDQMRVGIDLFCHDLFEIFVCPTFDLMDCKVPTEEAIGAIPTLVRDKIKKGDYEAFVSVVHDKDRWSVVIYDVVHNQLVYYSPGQDDEDMRRAVVVFYRFNEVWESLRDGPKPKRIAVIKQTQTRRESPSISQYAWWVLEFVACTVRDPDGLRRFLETEGRQYGFRDVLNSMMSRLECWLFGQSNERPSTDERPSAEIQLTFRPRLAETNQIGQKVWDKEDVDELRRLKGLGWTYARIGERLGRSWLSVQGKWNRIKGS
ncbi:hypothetical protein F5Y18DRAFT_395760 [Xylariaceae sp. FL1019]|nr:hypothetical protein F5Y18DRAFT_395760 [Xylariaceae sp. FL1019]